MGLEIARSLVISTAHVPQVLAQRMDDGKPIGTPYDNLGYGWRVYVPSESEPFDDDCAAAALRPLMTLARENDCRWIVFDSDGDQIEGFETFEW